MAPKKKGKGKLCAWLQCSLCGKFVSSQDAEVHSKSCDAEHGSIQGKVIYGKVIKAEKYFNEDAQNLSDKDNVVLLAIPTMQLCGLSIGQQCIVNRVLVKQAWPHKSVPLSSIALPAQCMEELGTKEDDMITVERFVPNDRIVQSAVLQLRDQNDVFAKAEFLSFAVSYLDGEYITEGSPLILKYFGEVCHCYVNNMICEMSLPNSERIIQGHVSLPSQSSQDSPNLQPRTPSNQTPYRGTVINKHSLVQENTPDKCNGDTLLCTSSQDISDSLDDLDISSLTINQTSTPNNSDRDTFPNLVTPVKISREHADCEVLSSDAFAKVSSKLTVLSVLRTGQDEQKKAHMTLADVGGLKSQTDELKANITIALQPSCTNRCILLHGPSGTGKTLLVKALTLDLGMNTVHITGTDIWSKLFGEAESNLHSIFKSAQEKAPSIIVIDDIDVICPKSSQTLAGQQEQRIVGTLLNLLDRTAASKTPSHTVIVIGITSNKDNIDPALRRAGRFGCEVEIGVPTAVQRREILDILLRKVSHNLTAKEIETVARNAHGYVGADLCALVNEACMHCLNHQAVSAPSRLSVNLIFKDLVHAGLVVKPSALREIQLEVPEVKWTDIGGMSEVKMRLREAVELPLSNPGVFKRFGIQSPRGLLMYGPPGCSKTMVARALATECKLNFLAVKGPEIFNQYVGESEKAIREVFRKARSAAPSIIFFDEIDAIAAMRGSSGGGSGVEDRVLTQLLTEMDGLEFLKDVFIIAATNRPDKIDTALLRPGRFDSLVYVPLPDAETRREILEKKISRMLVAHDVSLDSLVDATHNYSGAEIIQVCQEAALYALREDISAQDVHVLHFDAALEKVKPQIDPKLVQIYTKFST